MSPRALYDELIRKVAAVRGLEHRVAALRALLGTATATLAIWTLVTAIEAIGTFASDGRTRLFTGAVIANALAAAWLLLPAAARLLGIVRGDDDDALAHRIGSGIPAVSDRLLNTLQLFRTNLAGAAALGYSTDLVEASIIAQGEPLRHQDFGVIVDRDLSRRAIWLFLSSAIVAGSLFFVFPGTFRAAFDRLVHHDVDIAAPAPFTLAIAPGDRTLVRGDSVEIVVQARGVAPRSVTMTFDAGGRAPERVEVRGDANGVFRYHLARVDETTTYSASAGPVRSAEHTLRVVDRPEVTVLHASITHPSYTGRGTERLPDNVGDVAGLRGAAVSVTVTTNIVPARATLVQIFPRGVRLASVGASTPAAPTSHDTVRIPMTIGEADGSHGTAHASFRLTRSGEYYISLVSSDGITNTAPVHYRMVANGDAAPTIALIEPADSSTVDRSMLVPVQVHISDDYGFSRLRIMYRLAASRYAPAWQTFRVQTMPLPHGGNLSADVAYVWNMTAMDMVPEDVVQLYVEVADNDVVSGPKVARTDTILIRFPSLDEVLEKAEKTQTEATAELSRMLKQADEAAKEMQTLNRDLMKQLAQNQQEANWQSKQKLDELMKQHEQMQKRLEQVAENLRTMTEKLQEAKAVSPETLKKYAELQKLFEELKNPSLLEQMKKMQEQMQRMTPEQLAEAMKNYKYNDDQFRKSIERTMNILKRMQAEQKVDEMIRRADELERQQKDLNEQMAATNPSDSAMRRQLAERQQQTAKNAERMEQEMGDLQKQREALGQDAPQKELDEAKESLEKENPREGMEQAANEMEQGEMDRAQQQGKQAQQSTNSFKQKMQNVKKKMQENGRREVMNKMKKSLNDLLELSRREEELKRKTDAAQPNSQQFRDLARQQSELKEQMEQLTNQMMSLGQKSFAVTPEMGRELGNAMQQMEGAEGSLEQRDGSNASEQEGSAMGSMNNAAKMMSQALGQMQNQGEGQSGEGGMGMSMQQRLQQMAAQQQMINQAMSGQDGEGQQGEGQQQGQGKQQGKQQGQGEQEGEEGGEGKQGKNGKQGGNGSEGKEGEGNGQGNQGTQRDRLMRQQEDVRKSVEDLNKEANESGGTRKNMLGDLERASKEIDEVLTDMKTGQITPETLARQERILSRLLDAARSQRERDFDKKRESRPGQDVVRQGPGDLKLDTPADDDRERRDQLDLHDQGYTKDYEYMIRKYLESLGTGGASTLQ